MKNETCICGGPLQCLTDQEDDRHPILACAEGSACPGSPAGPSLPVAWCKCGHRLTFEQVRWRGRLEVTTTTGWRCHCEGCVDGGYDDDGQGVAQVSGEGDSPWEALDDLAAMHFDREPEALLVEGWK